MAICTLCEERELRPNSKLDTCDVCRGSMGWWIKRGAAALLERRRKLHIYDTRMQMVEIKISDTPRRRKR